jgi:SagB-type dehydrogenase family enzyme
LKPLFAAASTQFLEFNMAAEKKSRFKVSPTLVVLPNCEGLPSKHHIGLFDFMSKSFAFCPLETIYWLQVFHDWLTLDEAEKAHAHYPRQTFQEEIGALVNAGFILKRGTPESDAAEQYVQNWQWGIIPGIFHFTALDTEFCTQEQVSNRLSELAAANDGPVLSWQAQRRCVALPEPDGLNLKCGKDQRSLMNTMARRRTIRTSALHEVDSKEIGTCLFAGLGITAYVETPTGQLPLSMTPSGGARNPFEAFIFLNRSSELERCTYHYVASSHKLEVIDEAIPDNIAGLFANQDWMNNSAAIIVLVAVIERTTWKYNDANSYKVIPIEAGHIAQNIMLAATELGLTCCPTAALSHTPIAKALGLKEITHMPMYALTLDKSLPSEDRIVQNAQLPWASQNAL